MAKTPLEKRLFDIIRESPLHPSPKQMRTYAGSVRALVMQEVQQALASDGFVLCYPGVPDAWRVKPEDMPPAAPNSGPVPEGSDVPEKKAGIFTAAKALADRALDYVRLPAGAVDPRLDSDVEIEELALAVLALVPAGEEA